MKKKIKVNSEIVKNHTSIKFSVQNQFFFKFNIFWSWRILRFVFIFRLVGQTNEIFSWVIQLVIWQTLTAFIIGIKLVLAHNPSATRIINFTVIYVLEMLCYCYLADDINRKV
jgi:hypothetical protein